jgi:AcrR family transcriptional regulator
MRPLAEIADAAVRVFLDKGYRAAGIGDVSAALGLSHGAVYTYARSKQALLHLALLRTLDPPAVDRLTAPVDLPGLGGMDRLAVDWPLALPVLAAAAADPAGTGLGPVVDELYGYVEQRRPTLALVERCAPDLPELFQWYFVEQRRSVFAALGAYLGGRIDAGLLAPVPDVPVAARFVVESIAWFAMHRHGDQDSAELSDDDCRTGVRHLLLAAFPTVRTKGRRS